VTPIGCALVGPLANAIGASTAIITCSIGALLVTLITLLVPDIRTLRSKPASAAGGPSPKIAAT
jgi:hypothetical protein